MKSQFDGRCSRCAGKIRAGQEIEGRSGAWYHADCKPPITPVQQRKAAKSHVYRRSTARGQPIALNGITVRGEGRFAVILMFDIGGAGRKNDLRAQVSLHQSDEDADRRYRAQQAPNMWSGTQTGVYRAEIEA